MSTVTAVRSKLSSIKSRSSSGNMPQGSTLPAADQTRILTWLNRGAP